MDSYWKKILEIHERENAQDNPIITKLALLIHYAQEVNQTGHRCYFKNHLADIKKEGFTTYKENMIHALDFVGAEEYIDIVDFHFDNLYNSMCVYEDAVHSSSKIKEKNSQCKQLFKEVDCLYEETGTILNKRINDSINNNFNVLFAN